MLIPSMTTIVTPLLLLLCAAAAASSSNYTTTTTTSGSHHDDENCWTETNGSTKSGSSTSTAKNPKGIVYESSKEENIFVSTSAPIRVLEDAAAGGAPVCLPEDDFLMAVTTEGDDSEDEEEGDEEDEEEAENGDSADCDDGEEEEDCEYYTYEDIYDFDDESTWPYWHRDRFWEYHNCTGDFSSERPIPSDEMWIQLRQMYTDMVPYVQNSIFPLAPLAADNGFQVRVHVEQSPGKGRGVFADEFIPKHSVVYKSRWAARFPDPFTYREMLMELPAESACQVMVFTYLQDLSSSSSSKDHEESSQNKNITLTADLDIGALVNGGESRTVVNKLLGFELANIGCVPELASSVPGGCKQNDFALTDIYPGEELLSDYTEFVDQSWEEFGLDCDPSRC